MPLTNNKNIVDFIRPSNIENVTINNYSSICVKWHLSVKSFFIILCFGISVGIILNLFFRNLFTIKFMLNFLCKLLLT